MSKKRHKQRNNIQDRQLSIFFGDEGQNEPLTIENPEIETQENDKDLVMGSGQGTVNFVSFGSGSSGNCAYLGTAGSGILIDAGVDMDLVFKHLEENGVSPQMVKAILLTHDHADHIRYAYRIARKYKHIRIYCTPRMLNGMLRHHNISRRIRDYQENYFKEIPFHIAGMTVTAFETSHDGSDNAGFFIEVDNHTFAVATDMGEITSRALHYIPQAEFLMLESNYDPQMLENGKYPEYLKSRVRSEKGHLSNEVASNLVVENCLEHVKFVFLCHLSNENNTPELALSTMRQAIEGANRTVGDASFSVDDRSKDIHIYALPRYDCSQWFVF
ncbi:MAG: MBL fold metallo-hydrolase [Muribaculaceae bacterium]|nr:MBL fold metallo-hydrolase [Muribaculaceae bacterium]